MTITGGYVIATLCGIVGCWAAVWLCQELRGYRLTIRWRREHGDDDPDWSSEGRGPIR